MRIDLERPAGINLIHAVSPGEIRVGDRIMQRSFIIGVDDIIPDWPVSSTRDIDEESLSPILALAPEILLLGTGRALVFPGRDIHAAVLARNVGLEVMDTSAACRTYNILAAEGRSVIAALIVD
jgi:uncharacterized protein